MKKFFVWIGRLLVLLIALMLLVVIAVQIPAVQNFAVQKATTFLSKELGTEVSIKKVSLAFFNKANLDGILIRDQRKDTLLYAGKIQVRLTDWFFIKNKINLTYVGLENANIHLHRRDSVWNYAFIANYFATPKKQKKQPSQLAFSLEKIDLKQVRFFNEDEWIGENMIADIGSLVIQAKQLNFDKLNFHVQSILVDKPKFTIENYDGRRPPKKKTPKQKLSELYFNEAGLALQIDSIKITNGGFFNEIRDGEKPIPGEFSANHLALTKLQATLKNVRFIQDTLSANIQLQLQERCGLNIKKLNAGLRLTPQQLSLKNLELRTPKSSLTNYYAMQYNDFNKDMNDYIDSVRMVANFTNTTLHSDDVAYFAPELKTWKKFIQVSGKFNGFVRNFNINQMVLKSGGTSYVTGNLAMKGLPYINNTEIAFTNGFVSTSYNDLAIYVPTIKNIKELNLPALGNILFNGNFKGTLSKFTTTGTVSTQIGAVYANVNMQLPKNRPEIYSGTVETRQFNLGKLLNNSLLGNTSFKGALSGASFNTQKAVANINGNFSNLYLNGYNYTNISVNAALNKLMLKGELKADDPNLDITTEFNANLTKQNPSINLLGDLVQSDLKALGFTKQALTLTGFLDLNFTGNNIDNFLGSAKFLNADLKNGDQRLEFDSLIVKADLDSSGRKVLSASSNGFEAEVAGTFAIEQLPNTFQLFLHQYYPSLVNAPTQKPTKQNFEFIVKTKGFDSYARLLDKKFSGLDFASITGAVNTADSGTFYVQANIPTVRYGNIKLENVNINAFGDYGILDVDGVASNLYISDSTFFPSTNFTLSSKLDKSLVHIATSANAVLNKATLDAEVYTLDDGARISFLPSSFVLNNKQWALEKQGEIVIRKNLTYANNVKFVEGTQEISIETEEEEGGNANKLVVKLRDVNLGDFTPLFLKEPTIEGLANGNINLRNFYGNFSADTKLKATQFRLNGDSVGVVNIAANYSKAKNKLQYDVVSLNETYNFTSNGFYDFSDSAETPLFTNTDLKRAKIGVLNTFLKDLFSQIDGEASGSLVVSGKASALQLDGEVALSKAKLLVNYTQVAYTIDTANIVFTPNAMHFGEFTIQDKDGNSGAVQGSLYHQGFSNMRFDFDLSSNNILLLNTTQKDNNLFFGKAYGKAKFSLKGPQRAMQMKIAGEVTDTSEISINTSDGKSSTDANFIVFKQYGVEMAQPINTETQLSVDLDLTANNKAKINLILDDIEGDVIKAEGNGRLLIKIPAAGDMSINGRYNIERGNYDFNFQSLIKRPFVLTEGSGNYVEWTGNPYDAAIKVEAKYTAEKVSLNDLIGGNLMNFGGNIGAYRGDVYVFANISGKMAQPKIGFNIQFPANTGFQNNDTFQRFLASLKNDDNEMLKQVTWLIVFGTFAPYQQGGNATAANNIRVETIGINSISGVVTKELTKIVSNILYKITGDKSLSLDLSASTYSSSNLYSAGSGSNRLDRQQVNFKFNRSLYNGNVVVAVGGDFDFGVTSQSQLQSGTFQWLPDISVQVMLSKDRRLRGIVFNKSTLDVNGAAAIGRRNRQGVSLSYTKDFNKNPFKKEPTRKPFVLPAEAVLPAQGDSATTKK